MSIKNKIKKHSITIIPILFLIVSLKTDNLYSKKTNLPVANIQASKSSTQSVDTPTTVKQKTKSTLITTTTQILITKPTQTKAEKPTTKSKKTVPPKINSKSIMTPKTKVKMIKNTPPSPKTAPIKSIKQRPKTKSKPKTQPKATTTKPPATTPQKSSIKKTEKKITKVKKEISTAAQNDKPLTITDMKKYIKDIALAGGEKAISTFLKELCPPDTIIKMIKQLNTKAFQALERREKLYIIFSLAQHYKTNNKIKERMFKIITKTKSLAKGEIPILILAIKNKTNAPIKNIIEWDRKRTDDKKSKLEKEALDYAAKKDDLESLKILKQNGAEISPKKASKLIWLLVKENEGSKSIPFLVKNGGDINYENEGYTPLLRAIKNNNLETVKKLIELKADIKKSSKNKAIGSPLQKAREIGNIEIEMLLRKYGAKD